jgi:hypothetical protein
MKGREEEGRGDKCNKEENYMTKLFLIIELSLFELYYF